MKVRAPAKVNLQLRIFGRRADGFHEIETIIVPISLSDEITVEISPGDTITLTCDDPALSIDRSNLAAAAAYEFQLETGLRFAATIDLRKRIPIAGGFGGGSSDAAAVLSALDQLLETKLGIEGLQKIAAKIGSDVPFFVRPRPATCRGRGEIIEPFEVPERSEHSSDEAAIWRRNRLGLQGLGRWTCCAGRTRARAGPRLDQDF